MISRVAGNYSTFTGPNQQSIQSSLSTGKQYIGTQVAQIENIRHLNAPRLAFLGTASLGLFRTLVRALIHFNQIHLGIHGLVHVRWHQLVSTVNKLGSFYMNAKRFFVTTWYNYISFLHYRVVNHTYAILVINLFNLIY